MKQVNDLVPMLYQIVMGGLTYITLFYTLLFALIIAHLKMSNLTTRTSRDMYS